MFCAVFRVFRVLYCLRVLLALEVLIIRRFSVFVVFVKRTFYKHNRLKIKQLHVFVGRGRGSSCFSSVWCKRPILKKNKFSEKERFSKIEKLKF